MSTLGKCTFRELPPAYQALFEKGANRSEAEIFVPLKLPAAELVSVPIFMLIAGALPLAVVDLGLSLFSPIGLLLLLPLLGVLVASGLWIAALVRYEQQRRAGIITHGLLIDDENIVLRDLTLFHRKNCVFLPRGAIVSVQGGHEFDEAKGTNRSPTVWLLYRNADSKVVRLVLVRENTLVKSAYQVADMMQGLQKRLNGKWSQAQPDHPERATDTALHFEGDNGRLVDTLHNKTLGEIHFTYRHTGPRSIEIETVHPSGTPSAALEPGSYPFTIQVEYRLQGKFYMLRFEGLFFGSTTRAFGQAVEAEHALVLKKQTPHR